MSIATVKQLQLHLDDRGYLYEMLRNDDPCFTQFGQAYVSAVNPGAVKGFHKHFKQTDHVVCVSGQVKLVLVRERGSAFDVEEYHLSPIAPKMVVIPTEVYHGWMCIGNEPALIVNFSTLPFDAGNPDEQRVDPHDNPWGYVWEVKDG